jgi:hypothetical protein
MPKDANNQYYFSLLVDRSTLEKIRGLLKAKGFDVTGDEGTFSEKGILFGYDYFEQTGSLIITIKKKSVLLTAAGVSNESIEADVRAAFSKAVEESDGQTKKA